MFLAQKTRLQKSPGKSRTNHRKKLFRLKEETLQKVFTFSRERSKAGSISALVCEGPASS